MKHEEMKRFGGDIIKNNSCIEEGYGDSEQRERRKRR